jgi:hypothetical protein
VPFSNTEFGFAPFPSVPRRSGGGSLNTVGSDADPEELATDGRDAPRDLGGPGPARPSRASYLSRTAAPSEGPGRGWPRNAQGI